MDLKELDFERLSDTEIKIIRREESIIVRKNSGDFFEQLLWMSAEMYLANKEPKEPIQYGCHCDLEEGMEPDGCVLDTGHVSECTSAMRLQASGKGKTDCEYWQPIKIID